MAIILQELLRETRQLKEENRGLREEFRKGLQERTVHQTESAPPKRRRRRNTAPKDCQVKSLIIFYVSFSGRFAVSFTLFGLPEIYFEL